MYRNVKPQFEWIYDFKRNMKSIMHTLYFGQTTFGKTYGAFWRQEIEIDQGIAKCFSLWNNRYPAEPEAMIYPNKDALKLYKNKKINKEPHAFDVAVYIPITENMPKNLPKYYIPFTISCKKLSSTGIKMLYGRKNVQTMSSIYSQIQKNIKKEDTFIDLQKAIFEKKEFRGATTIKGFNDVEIPIFTESQYATYSSFLARIGQIGSIGILSSDIFPLSIDTLLKRELRKQKRYVVLNTSFIKNLNIKAFVVIEFIEAIRRALRTPHRMPFDKVILYFNEAGDLFPPKGSERFQPVHAPLIEYGIDVINRIRHEKCELHMDVQSPNNINKEIRGQGLQIIVNRIRDPDQLYRYVREIDSELENEDLSEIQNFEKGAFHILGDIMSTFRDGKRQVKSGYRLPRPRLARHEELTLSEHQKFPTRSSEKYKKMLSDEWGPKAKELKKFIEKVRNDSQSASASTKEVRLIKVKGFLMQQTIGAIFSYTEIAKGSKVKPKYIAEVIRELEVDENIIFDRSHDADDRRKVIITILEINKEENKEEK